MVSRDGIIKSRGYDPSIFGDELSLKISSYSVSAEYLAARLADENKTICELCCGVGVSLIHLSKRFKNIIGVDSNTDVLSNCEKNLENAAVENYKLLHGDVSSPDVLSKINADIVLYDIPYWSNHNGEVDIAKQNPDLGSIVSNIKKFITEDIVIYAPPHYSYEEMKSVIGDCEYVQVFIDGEYDRNFIFSGSLVNKVGKSKVLLTK